jgi:hypothetical protein
MLSDRRKFVSAAGRGGRRRTGRDLGEQMEGRVGFLDKIFGRKGDKEAPVAERPSASAAVDCPHAAVTPRWDNAADMGKKELVSAYVCESCGGRFSREEGETLGVAAADRIRISEEERQKGMQR